MRKRSPARRTIAAALATALLGFGAVNLFAAPASAAPGHHRRNTDSMGPEDSADHKLPAPPKPPRSVPVERVVTTGRTPAKTKSAFTNALTAALTTTTPSTKTSSGTGAPGSNASTKTLVLYDSSGAWGWLGEDYGISATNLVSHFGGWTAHPVTSYKAGELNGYAAVVYVGSTYDEALPVEFLDDVLGTTKQVVWMYDNIWQLTARQADFTAKYGFTWKGFDFSTVTQVNYKGTALSRDAVNASGIMDYVITDPTKVTTIGSAVRADGTSFPWAVRSGNLTYVGEIPFAYVTGDDRYLAFSDVLFDVLAPTTVARHRALVRIEDVGPDADPAELRAVTDYLYSKKIPFSVAVYSRYRDPKGVNSGGKAEDYTLRSRPLVVSALKYMRSKGGTLIMHGYTHQLDSLNNPYDGVSADDFEFYLAHIDAANNVVYDGPVKNDSVLSAASRVTASRIDWLLAGLSQPTTFEFPHYAGSATDYKTVNSLFSTRYDRGLYFPGVISGGTVDSTKLVGQFFPYSVRDVYGTAVVPENLGNIEPLPFNNHPARLPADLINTAKSNLAVRDGSASFFYHPYLGTEYLKQTVEGIQSLGYTFVSAGSMV